MYTCRITGTDNTNQYEELIRVFMPDRNYRLLTDSTDEVCGYSSFAYDGDRNELKRRLYRDLEKHTGKSPKWGILTGIRPVKLAGEMYRKCGDLMQVRRDLEREYLLDRSKSSLTAEILEYQLKTAGLPQENSMSVYLGIPFCPTRCLYCSFTSNQVERTEIDRYLEALYREIEYCGKRVRAGNY
ncbi:MAG: hypothetical protein ACI4LD_05140, partial [Lentihominibacter sp.]